jgi:2-dehydro-3-deoxy-D-arabinonate dehydratase
MRLCRFKTNDDEIHVGLLRENDEVSDLSAAGIDSLTALLEEPNPVERVEAIAGQTGPVYGLAQVQLLVPLEQQEVWAAGVTYLRSRTARMAESSFNALAYDRVYEAERPEIFFKSLAEKVVGPGDAVGIRRDSRWSVPEPELALMINSRGQVTGFTLGNDMSARDLEGENLLYLPQAKTYARSCALGPAIKIGVSEENVRTWQIALSIRRSGEVVFQGETTLARIKRTFSELASFLYRCQAFPHGTVLLTGTGIVPPEDFSLAARDQISIHIPEVGLLENEVVVV